MFGTGHSLNREALEEVVQVFIKFARSPSSESTRKKKRIRPVDGTLINDGL